MKNLEDLTYGQLISYTKGLEKQIEDLKHINSELEYRLEKLNIKPIIEVREHKDALGEVVSIIKTKTIPEIKYYEYTKFQKGDD